MAEDGESAVALNGGALKAPAPPTAQYANAPGLGRVRRRKSEIEDYVKDLRNRVTQIESFGPAGMAAKGDQKVWVQMLEEEIQANGELIKFYEGQIADLLERQALEAIASGR